MAIRHDALVSEIVVVDPGDARGPWTVGAPVPPLANNDRWGIVATTGGQTKVTLDFTGSSPLLSPELGDITTTIDFVMASGTMEFVYNSGLDRWHLYHLITPLAFTDTYDQTGTAAYTVGGTAINLQVSTASQDQYWTLLNPTTLQATTSFYGALSFSYENQIVLTANNADINTELRLAGTARTLHGSFFDSFAHSRIATFDRTWTHSTIIVADPGETITLTAYEIDANGGSGLIQNLALNLSW